MSMEALLKEFAEVSATPKAQLKKYKAEGKKVIGVLPYYAPEELVYAAGMVPMGIWGTNTKSIARAKEYCATFYCTIAQLALEMLLDGTMDDLDGMAKAYYKAPNSVCIEQGVAWREGICVDNKVDGVLVHYNRSCKPWSGYMAEMQRRFTNDLGIPCAGFDGDQADPRNFNEAQYVTRVQGLMEAMEANDAK